MRAVTGTISGLKNKSIRLWLYAYYYAKSRVRAFVVGDDGLASVLYDSLVPDIALRIGGAKIGRNVRVHRHLVLHESRGSFRNLEIGDDVFIGRSCTIDLSDRVRIGNRCGIGMGVQVITHINLGDSCLSQRHPPETAPVEIMEDSVVLWGCILNKGTVIERQTLVLPGSVVSGRLAQGSTYCGNPARVTLTRERPK